MTSTQKIIEVLGRLAYQTHPLVRWRIKWIEDFVLLLDAFGSSKDDRILLMRRLIRLAESALETLETGKNDLKMATPMGDVELHFYELITTEQSDFGE